jgi:hypothetical protein
MVAEPDKPACEDQTQQQQTTTGDLPVALAKNEICVSFIPFATSFEIRVALHADALTVKIRNSHIKVPFVELVGRASSLPSAGLEQGVEGNGREGMSAVCARVRE